MIEFVGWTFILYWIHRLVHRSALLMQWHGDHHKFINAQGSKSCWQWNNLLLFNDTWRSTIDLWITEVLPTLLFSYITGAWWVSVFYYVWAAFLQELLEHHPQINWYPFTAGAWHLVHHRMPNRNYGLFLPVWDKLFGTEYGRT